MHDRLDHHGMNDMNDEASLTAALRALPASAPPQDAWRNLSARIGRRRTVVARRERVVEHLDDVQPVVAKLHQ